jgi:hypothetical protein
VAGLTAGNGALAHHLTAVVHRIGEARVAPEGAEVDHPALLRPREGMLTLIRGRGALADDLAALVQRMREAEITAQRAEIDWRRKRGATAVDCR